MNSTTILIFGSLLLSALIPLIGEVDYNFLKWINILLASIIVFLVSFNSNLSRQNNIYRGALVLIRCYCPTPPKFFDNRDSFIYQRSGDPIYFSLLNHKQDLNKLLYPPKAHQEDMYTLVSDYKSTFLEIELDSPTLIYNNLKKVDEVHAKLLQSNTEQIDDRLLWTLRFILIEFLAGTINLNDRKGMESWSPIFPLQHLSSSVRKASPFYPIIHALKNIIEETWTDSLQSLNDEPRHYNIFYQNILSQELEHIREKYPHCNPSKFDQWVSRHKSYGKTPSIEMMK